MEEVQQNFLANKNKVKRIESIVTTTCVLKYCHLKVKYY